MNTFLQEFREWTTWIAEWLIVGILIMEYMYDAEKDAKRSKRTRTIKKTTTQPSGDIVVTEDIETVENKGDTDVKSN